MKIGKKRLRLLLFVLFLGYTIIYIDKLSVGFALIPISEEFNFSPAVKGQIMSAFFAGYALMQIPMGLVINKVGARLVLIFSIVAVGIFSLLFGFGTSIIMFIIIRFLTGLIAHSGYSSSASTEVALNFPPEKRTFAQGILLSSAGFASIIGPLLLPFVMTNWGWRSAYNLLTILSMIVAVFLVVIIPKNSKQSTNSQLTKEPISVVWSDKRVWVLFFSAFFINCLLYGFTNWVPSFLTAERALSLESTGFVTAVVGAFALIGSVGGSYFVGQYFQNREKHVVAVTAMIGSLLMFISYFVNQVVLLSVVLGISNFFLILCFVTLMVIPLKIFEGIRLAPSYATVATGGILGGFVSPIIIGWLVNRTGSFISTFVFFLFLGIATALATLFIKKVK